MGSAVWGLIGTVVGGLIAFGSNWLQQRTDRDERARRERREAAARARDERKQAYMRLLSAARQLRYRARQGSVTDADEIQEIKTDLSTSATDALPATASRTHQVRGLRNRARHGDPASP